MYDIWIESFNDLSNFENYIRNNSREMLNLLLFHQEWRNLFNWY